MDVWEQMIDGLVSMSASSPNREAEGDYHENGLLMCGKCHTPKQHRITIHGRELIPYCQCRCAMEREARERAAENERLRKERREERRRAAFAEPTLIDCRFETAQGGDQHAFDVARNYAENFGDMRNDGRGLIFYGDVGTGKTFLAACIVNALIDNGYSCLMTSFTRVVNTMSGMYDGKQDYLDGLNEYDLIVFDDFAAERDTEYMLEQVFAIIDCRLGAGKPMVLTTNLTASELKNPGDMMRSRMYSRLYASCFPVSVNGADRRRQQSRDNYEKYKKLLGI